MNEQRASRFQGKGSFWLGEMLHARLRVSDLDASIQWFQALIGFELTDQKISPDGNQLAWLELPGENTELELAYSDDFGAIDLQEDLFHLAFAVEDMGSFQQKVKSLGLEISWGPVERSGGGQIAFVDHPDGYEIEFISKR